MNRYRIWHVGAVLLLASCKPLQQQPAVTQAPVLQQAPNLSQQLAPGSAELDPSVTAATITATAGPAPVLKRVKVGLLLPLTGRNAELGKALQDAATVSLFDKYSSLSVRQQGIRVELLPRDTGDTPQQAVVAMNQALADGAEFIIGPLTADATEAVADMAKTKNISVLSFSNNQSRAEPNVYTFGFSPQEQTRRVVGYALQHGKGRIAVLAPETPLGDTVLAAATDRVRTSGLALSATARYAAQGTGLEAALSRLVPQAGQPNFDALLIPEGGPALDTILRSLAARGVNPGNVQFLGTGIWDDANLLRRTNLNGAWVASSPPNLTAQFEDRFRLHYRYAPPRIASLAYDAVALTVTLATSERAFDAKNLTNNGGFNGPANGIFRLRPTGQTERGLAVMHVQGSGLQLLEPSPIGFSGN